jgi:hypothetical protein
MTNCQFSILNEENQTLVFISRWSLFISKTKTYLAKFK